VALVVLSKVEQRLDAVRAVLAGREVSDFAVVLGCRSRRCLQAGPLPHRSDLGLRSEESSAGVSARGGFPVPSRQRAPHSADASPEQGPRSARPRSGEGERP